MTAFQDDFIVMLRVFAQHPNRFDFNNEILIYNTSG